MNSDEAAELVFKILAGMPVEVFDDDDGSVWENEQWELVTPRREGDFAGSRAIGSANLVTALNLIHQKILIHRSESDITSSSDTSLSIFNVAMKQLQDTRLVRRKPNKIRETFKIIKTD
jgi:predicted PhzF superfamily epimerase YddE/YHI9